MPLLDLRQIKGGLKLQQNVTNLLTSYAASKVITSVNKALGPNGEEYGVYNTDELLTELKSTMDEVINGSNGISLTSLNDAIQGINNKAIKDIVKVRLSATYEDGDPGTYEIEALDGFTTSMIPKIKTTTELLVYLDDNTAVFDENGHQLTYDFYSNEFSGIPSVLDIEASKLAQDNELVYKPLQDDFVFKVFPQGEFTLSTLPADFMLDNGELQLVAYDITINKIIVELSKDADLMAAVQAAVTDEAINAKITAIFNTVLQRVNALEENSLNSDDIATTIRSQTNAVDTKVASEKAVADALAAFSRFDELNSKITQIRERLSGVETLMLPVKESFAVTGTSEVSSFTLTQVPNNMEVQININGFTYLENNQFTVDRTTPEITWNKVDAGFAITGEITDEVNVYYHVGTAVSNPDTVQILHMDNIPTTGSYNVGDMVYRITPIPNVNAGWICSKAGTAQTAEWMTFGVIDFEHTVYIEESAPETPETPETPEQEPSGE